MRSKSLPSEDFKRKKVIGNTLPKSEILLLHLVNTFLLSYAL